MKKTYSELIEYYENVSPREIIADMYFDYKEEIDNLNNLGKQLVEENEELKSQLQQKENIIKEVREYKKQLLFDLNRQYITFEKWEEILDPIDYILDKEVN